MDRRFAVRLVGPGLAVSYVGVRRGGCVVAFFACLYFAMLRPSETVALHADDCHLPESGWGPPRPEPDHAKLRQAMDRHQGRT
jgi:hypothetical protein